MTHSLLMSPFILSRNLQKKKSPSRNFKSVKLDLKTERLFRKCFYLKLSLLWKTGGIWLSNFHFIDNKFSYRKARKLGYRECVLAQFPRPGKRGRRSKHQNVCRQALGIIKCERGVRIDIINYRPNDVKLFHFSFTRDMVKTLKALIYSFFFPKKSSTNELLLNTSL